MEETRYYTLFDRVALRTPLMPFENVQQGLWDSDALKSYFGSAIAKEALYIASPDLFDRFEKWQSGELKDEKKVAKLVSSLAKYLERMCTRCTPFGLFAGIGIGTLAERTSCFLGDPTRYGRRTRLDMHYLCALAEHLSLKEEIRDRLTYFKNSSLYESSGGYRYYEAVQKDGQRRHTIVSVEKNGYLAELISACENGADYTKLLLLLVGKGAGFESAVAYLNDLIASQVLVSQLEPNVTGMDFLAHIISVLGTIESDTAVRYHSRLCEISYLLADTDSQDLGLDSGNYPKIIDIIREMGAPFDPKKLFQVDMYAALSDLTLSRGIAKETLRVAETIIRLSSGTANPRLEEFKKAYRERYEGREMPLLKVLDTETGLGYGRKGATPSVLLEGMGIAASAGVSGGARCR